MSFLNKFKSMTTSVSLLVVFPTVPTVPGSFCTQSNPDFQELRYKENIPICERNVSSARKDKICLRDGIKNRKEFTVDHMIPLFAGGSNADDNLWCQHKSINSADYELEVYKKLSAGDLTRDEAVSLIKKYKFQGRVR